MVTEKLFYQDPYIQSFSAHVLQSGTDEAGRFYVVLDQTAFYPTGGGQPHDTGAINGVQVHDVEEVGGELRHYSEIPIEGEECSGKIDWPRRFDHMQQHAGQHIVSAAFEELYGYKTISFHLGKETCTIDLEVPALIEEEANRAEERANAMILENRPIEARWVTAEELCQFPLRKALSVTENIRLVIIPDFDYNGCGGTHPRTTGEVSAVKILHWEKQKKHIRVHFVCGNRVLKQLHEKHRVTQRLTSLLNASEENLVAAASRVLEQQRQLEKTMEELKGQLLLQEAQKLIEQGTVTSNYTLVKRVYTNKTMAELQQLAKQITQLSNSVLVLLVNEVDQKLQVVGARGQDLTISMKELMKNILPLINGKGGGSDVMAQGGGEQILSPEAVMEKMLEAIAVC